MKKNLFFFCLILSSNCLFGDIVDEGIKQLSMTERHHLRSFFDKAINVDNAAHVLHFQNKPVALIAVILENKGKPFKKEKNVFKGWEAFKKKEHLFPHPNYIFSENLFTSAEDFKVLHIYLINKSSLTATLKKYKSLFQEVLGLNFSPSEFISKLEAGEPLPSLVNKDELLTGLLLGFGEDSSKAFKEMVVKCAECMPPPQTDTYCRINIKCPKGCKMHPIVFIGNPNSKEVKQLKSTYEKELKETWEVYKNSKNTLKTTLERLCSN